MYIHIGEALQECRIKKGWSKNKLALYAKVSRHTIDRIEGTGCGNIENVERMLGVMGYELEVLPREYRRHRKGDPQE